MLELSQIKKFYPETLQGFERLIIREYLQYQILRLLFNGPHSHKLTFLGGTCLRIVHGNQRFSEDLDFDNRNLSEAEFGEVSANLQKELIELGYQSEIQSVYRGAYHCYIKFPNLLYQNGLSGYSNEKILIQLDTEPQFFEYQPIDIIINKFDVFEKIQSTPLPLLMAQKCYAVLNRKRNKGRDFFDLAFLMSLQVKPDMTYLKEKLDVTTTDELKIRLLNKCKNLDMKTMAQDVEPFLFIPGDIKKVKYFEELLSAYKL
ncbi:MAG: nucleotidyl transferase AbiEii/AbiGii toxin family protein [Bacteroidetes bacterium]|nr:nucleotidyl transferase AbiEii/AbiGii toxin family protein [Bacteroidota bacterium]